MKTTVIIFVVLLTFSACSQVPLNNYPELVSVGKISDLELNRTRVIRYLSGKYVLKSGDDHQNYSFQFYPAEDSILTISVHIICKVKPHNEDEKYILLGKIAKTYQTIVSDLHSLRFRFGDSDSWFSHEVVVNSGAFPELSSFAGCRIRADR